MEQRWICPECSVTIAPEDTFVFRNRRPAHLDCKRPHMLRPEERAILFRFCSDHAVVQCGPCARGYLLTELASDLYAGRDHLCSRCRADLTDGVRAHLDICPKLSATVRESARRAQEAARRLVERCEELDDAGDALMRELEVALQVLREAMSHEPPKRGA